MLPGMGSANPRTKSQDTKLEAKARRKATAKSKPRRTAASGQGKGGLWLPLLAVGALSAAGGYYAHDPAGAHKQLAGLQERLQAAGTALSGEPDSAKSTGDPKSAVKTAGLVAPGSPAAFTAPRAIPVTPERKDTSLTAAPAPNEAKPAAKAKSAWPIEDQRLFAAALAKRDMEDLKEVLAQHQQVLPHEGNLEQDALTMAVARRKHQDVEFLLAAGFSPDRVIRTPAKAEFLELVGNATFTRAATTEKNVTLLMLAAATGDSKMVELLYNKGARNRTTIMSKFTALDFAVAANKPEAIQACLGRKPGDESSRIIVSLKDRTATFIQDGRIRERSWISSGRSGHATPTGRFVVTQKHKDWTSTKYHVKMPYFLRLNNGPIGLHAGVVPPYPASRGCIRLPDEHARTFFQMAEVGTIVDIVN